MKPISCKFLITIIVCSVLSSFSGEAFASPSTPVQNIVGPEYLPITPTPVPSPSPSAPPICLGYSIDINLAPGSGAIGLNRKTDIFTDRGDDIPACFLNVYDEVYNACFAAIGSYNASKHNNQNPWYVDDCVVASLQGADRGQDDRHYPLTEYSDFIRSGYNASCSSVADLTNWSGDRIQRCDTGTAYFDESCNPIDISTNDVSAACDVGKLNWHGSPISLLIDSSIEDLSKGSTIVSFSLRPDAGDYSLWKASDKAPLLVFDPEHKGIITSSSQLFGEWTFGGKAKASLSSKIKSDTNADAEAWDNGFSALATLDSNQDGKIAGEELTSLGLWYDKNRDAVSDKGEVRSLEEVGVKTLYYKNTVKDPITGDVILSLGYEIETNGVLTQGVAVDWYGVTAKSEVELLQRSNALASLCSAGSESSEMIAYDPTSDFASVNRKDPGFSGAWDWVSDDGSSAGGMLAFSVDDEGKLKGVSMFQVSLNDSSRIDFSKAVQMLKLSGSLTSSAEEDVQKLAFFHQSPDGTILESNVELSKDKNHLIGRTTALATNGMSKKIISFYTWSATRHVK